MNHSFDIFELLEVTKKRNRPNSHQQISGSGIDARKKCCIFDQKGYNEHQFFHPTGLKVNTPNRRYNSD